MLNMNLMTQELKLSWDIYMEGFSFAIEEMRKKKKKKLILH